MLETYIYFMLSSDQWEVAPMELRVLQYFLAVAREQNI